MLSPMEKLTPHNADHSDHNVGPRIRELRTQRGLSLREVASRIGISASALSQMETGKRTPSVPRLHQIINVLGAPLSAVFGEESTATNRTWGLPEDIATSREVIVKHAGTAPEITLEGGVHWLRLLPVPIPGIDLMEVTYPPGIGADEHMRHNGNETAYVVSGSLTFDVGFDHHTIESGGSISYPSTTPHRVRNTGNEVAVAIWLVLDPPGHLP